MKLWTFALGISVSQEDITHDNLPRAYFKTPYSGPQSLRIRSSKYNSTIVSTHVTDLFEILKEVKDEKSVFMFLSDGGTDFNPSHLVNNLFYFRFFKELDPDIFGVMTFAARYPAYNPIKHLWTPLNNCLLSVVFSSIAYGDSMAPAQQHGLTESETLKKEFEVFDHAMYDIAENHW